MKRAALLLCLCCPCVVSPVGRAEAQQTAPAFDVVSIKPNDGSQPGGGIRTLPDGTLMMTNQPIRSILARAAPVPVREVIGYPDWVERERYDVVARPPAGATAEQRAAMWQALFADRMKLRAHVEEREQDTYALVVASSDGRLGPDLMPSTLDCAPRAPGAPPPPPPDFSSPDAYRTRCGAMFGGGSVVAGSLTMDSFVRSLSSMVGRLVNNRTRLEGGYTFTLRYAPRDGAPSTDPADPPDISTALQEQLGLKLQPETSTVPVLVIDHIERPTEN